MTFQGAPSSSSCSPVPALWPKVLQFRITLVGIYPPLVRIIQVPDDYVFFGLHSAIQDAIGWGSHCDYRFEHFTRCRGPAIELPVKGSVPSYEHDFLVSSYFVDSGDIASYSVDRYDSQWRFQLLLEKAAVPVEGVSYPRCVDGRRGCPNIGIGYKAFVDHVNAATNPYHSKHLDSIGSLTSMGYSDQFNPQSVVFKDPKILFQLNYRR